MSKHARDLSMAEMSAVRKSLRAIILRYAPSPEAKLKGASEIQYRSITQLVGDLGDGLNYGNWPWVDIQKEAHNASI